MHDLFGLPLVFPCDVSKDLTLDTPPSPHHRQAIFTDMLRKLMSPATTLPFALVRAQQGD